MVSWIGLLLPIAYLGILVGSLATFSSLYRNRKACKKTSYRYIYRSIELTLAAKAASLAPWFDPHVQRNIYLSLRHLEPESGAKVPESVLKAALLRRATEDIHRLIGIRNQKQALATLLQRGSVGDELWQRYQRAEKEIEEELKDVVTEVRLRQTLGIPKFSHEGGYPLTYPGQRFRTELGTSHLSVRQRDRKQSIAAQAHGGVAVASCVREGVVGKKEGEHAARVHEGARNRKAGCQGKDWPFGHRQKQR